MHIHHNSIMTLQLTRYSYAYSSQQYYDSSAYSTAMHIHHKSIMTLQLTWYSYAYSSQQFYDFCLHGTAMHIHHNSIMTLLLTRYCPVSLVLFFNVVLNFSVVQQLVLTSESRCKSEWKVVEPTTSSSQVQCSKLAISALTLLVGSSDL